MELFYRLCQAYGGHSVREFGRLSQFDEGNVIVAVRVVPVWVSEDLAVGETERIKTGYKEAETVLLLIRNAPSANSWLEPSSTYLIRDLFKS